MNLDMLSVVAILAVSLLTLYLVAQKKLSFRLSVAFLFLGFGMVFFVIFNEMLMKVSSYLGFEYLSNFIFFVSILILILFIVQLGASITKIERNLEQLNIDVAKASLTFPDEQ
jgi:hypothetical protein